MDENKQTGGYSLELINLNDPCSDMSNWSASNSETGGTPGTENSIYDNNADEDAPYITRDSYTASKFFGNLFQRGNGLHIISKCIY